MSPVSPARPREDFRVDVYDGKYTFVYYKDGTLGILRYGEPWIYPVEIGVNAISALVYELHKTRDTLARHQSIPMQLPLPLYDHHRPVSKASETTF